MDRQGDAAWRAAHQGPFDLEQHGDLLVAILGEVQGRPIAAPDKELARILRQHPLPDGHLLSKDQVPEGTRNYANRGDNFPIPNWYGGYRQNPRAPSRAWPR